MDSREAFYALMRSGEPYLADAALLDDYQRAQELCRKFNSSDDRSFCREVMGEITGRELDPSVTVLPPFHIDFGRFTEFGKDVFVNFGATFADQGGITIGNGVKLGPNVTLITTNHLLEPEKRRYMVNRPIVLEDDVWIGANATILPGVTVGRGAVIGAASVVTRDVPPMTVVAGNPARVIKEI